MPSANLDTDLPPWDARAPHTEAERAARHRFILDRHRRQIKAAMYACYRTIQDSIVRVGDSHPMNSRLWRELDETFEMWAFRSEAQIKKLHELHFDERDRKVDAVKVELEDLEPRVAAAAGQRQTVHAAKLVTVLDWIDRQVSARDHAHRRRHRWRSHLCSRILLRGSRACSSEFPSTLWTRRTDQMPARHPSSGTFLHPDSEGSGLDSLSCDAPSPFPVRARGTVARAW